MSNDGLRATGEHGRESMTQREQKWEESKSIDNSGMQVGVVSRSSIFTFEIEWND